MCTCSFFGHRDLNIAYIHIIHTCAYLEQHVVPLLSFWKFDVFLLALLKDRESKTKLTYVLNPKSLQL